MLQNWWQTITFLNCFYYLRLNNDLLLTKNTLCGLIIWKKKQKQQQKQQQNNPKNTRPKTINLHMYRYLSKVPSDIHNSSRSKICTRAVKSLLSQHHIHDILHAGGHNIFFHMTGYLQKSREIHCITIGK